MDPRDPFPDKKLEQHQNSVPPVKRPRQKGLHFDFAKVPQQQRSDCPPDLATQLQDMSLQPAGASQHWVPVIPQLQRRDTPEPIMGIKVPEDNAHQSQSVPLQSWVPKNAQQRHRPLYPVDRVPPRVSMDDPSRVMMGHVPFPVESYEDSIASSPFSTARTDTCSERIMELMNEPPAPPMFELQRRPGFSVMPPQDRKMQSAAGGLFAEDEGYDTLPSGYAGKDWLAKEAEMAGHRFRQLRRSRHPGPNREPDLGSYFARPNSLFDFGYPPDGNLERTSGRISDMRDRLRRLDHRHGPLEDREQEARSTMDRHRTRPHNRDRRSPCRGGEFGALMNALGLVPDDDTPGSRDDSSGFSRMRQAVFGIVNSRLPPHLLFSDRDFDGDDYEFLCRLDESVESRKGADDQVINKINLCSFGSKEMGNGSSETEPRCPICLENFSPGVEIRVMPCRHHYHRNCLDKWLKIKAVCPICNMNIKDKFMGDASEKY